ncbi:MAG TPA: hypothetical protein VGM43_23215 [Bryobacteraceae bacterium]|jgi:hypothetical protein
MSPFDALAGVALTTIQGVFGSSSNFTYSRRASSSFTALAAFAITGSLNAGGEYTSPDGPILASLLVKVADIPQGPQKGDIVTISGYASIPSGDYFVQEIFKDAAVGWAELKIRLTSK